MKKMSEESDAIAVDDDMYRPRMFDQPDDSVKKWTNSKIVVTLYLSRGLEVLTIRSHIAVRVLTR